MQKKQDIAIAEQWWGNCNPNRSCTRSVGSPGPDTVQCRQNEISQQQKNSSRAVLTQIGHEPGRLEAQGQTAVQCKRNENLQQQNSSGAVSTQIGYAGRAILRSSRTVAGQFQIRSGMHPSGWKPRVRQEFSAVQAILRSSRTK